MHGLVGSKDQPHRILVALSEALAAAGHVALRFDLLGRGDSEGKSIDDGLQPSQMRFGRPSVSDDFISPISTEF